MPLFRFVKQLSSIFFTLLFGRASGLSKSPAIILSQPNFHSRLFPTHCASFAADVPDFSKRLGNCK